MTSVLTRQPASTAWQEMQDATWITDLLDRSTSEDSIDAAWRERRSHHRAHGRRLANGHRDHYLNDLRQSQASLRRFGVADLLAEASTAFGITWSDIARLVGVSVPALRKWRRDQNAASPANHDRLAGLVAFLRMLKKIGVYEPATWLAMPLHPDFTVAPRDLYQVGNVAALLDHAAGNVTVEDMLDEVTPDWRQLWPREHDVITDDAGEQFLVRRAPRPTIQH